jgi:hypothetical protein
MWLWYSRTHNGISLAAGDHGYSALDMRAANELLVHVNLYLREAMSDQMKLIRWRNKSRYLDSGFVLMWLDFEVAMVYAMSLQNIGPSADNLS